MYLDIVPRAAASRWFLWAVLLALLAFAVPARSQDSAAVTYADVAPILAERCVMCHAGDAAPAGLRLDSFESVLQGGLKGAVVKAGDPAGSELIRRIKGSSLPQMPMTGPPFLSDSQVATFERWVAAGLREGEPKEAAAATQVRPRGPAPGEPVTYAHIAPILATRCAKCHTESGLMGPAPEGYRLTSYEATLASFDRVRVVPGKPEASELVRRIRGQSLSRMPYDGPPYLADDEIRLIETWIAGGARSADGVAAAVPAGADVRLHGTLRSRWQLDDLPLAVGGWTRIDKSPAPGDYVEVRGRLDETGEVEVERLRRR